MKTIIAEKPSVAKDIAFYVGALEKKDGYMQGNGYYVTWAYGHLIANAMPNDYGLNSFTKEVLPIIPNKFLLTVRKVKGKNGYTEDQTAVAQLKKINELFKNSESLIVATDAGREGELIFRYIYEYLKSDKPFQRLWLSSLTEKAIKIGFDNLRDGKDYDLLYYAALSRSRADWLVGINSTQALSIAAGNGLYSLGRVQTPTLAIICKRYLENKNYTIKKFWQIELSHQYGGMTFKSLSSLKWDDEGLANDAQRAIGRANSATVASVTTKTITELPPLLFDLTGLQKEANQKLNLSADETLNVAQGLYEKKFITYPRTGSKHIPEDMWPEIPKLLRALKQRQSCKLLTQEIHFGRLNKRIVNDLRVTDHHGLLPTEKIPSALNAVENAIYDMIAFRLLEAVSGNCTKELSTVLLEVFHYHFFAKGTIIIEAGWRSVKGNFSNENDDDIQDLPNLQEGNVVKIDKVTLLAKNTKPPVLYTEASLLAAMEHAGRDVDDAEGRHALENLGIGTPATRSLIIETLFDRNYIKRDKKSLIPTAKGLQVYNAVKNYRISDVSLTAEWELMMKKIEIGQADALQFQKNVKDFTRNITAELLSTNIPDQNTFIQTCPRCKSQALVLREKLIKCPDEDCNWVQFRNVCGVEISIADLENLVKNGRTSLLKGLKSRSGKLFDACIVLDSNYKTFFEFSKNKK
ncbi:DNA topoisomerase [Pedobacter sp. KLB.chiD]|uniref:type IA DNA topoisomerase n=1 Tax=Pedobacter sp. KLB.chiD TaxID=3387402 RepID=UPI00399AA25F